MLIHVCYSLYDVSGKYSKFLGMSIQSLLDNTDETVTIHVLHDSTLTKDNRNKLTKIAYSHEQEIIFYNVDILVPNEKQKIFDGVPYLKSRFSVACFYRAMIPNILSTTIDKAIYLDADTIINFDIKEFWGIDLQKFPIAAIPESKSGHTKESMSSVNLLIKDGVFIWNDYFNSGVLMMNLDQLRISTEDGNLLDRCLAFFEKYPNATDCPDQNALNFVFKENYLKLPVKFNRLVFLNRKFRKSQKVGREIIHYAAHAFGIDFKDEFNQLWFEYYSRTPFFSPEKVVDLLASSQRFELQKGNLWKKIVNLDVTRQRGFFIYPKDSDRIIQFIGKNDEDIGLNAEIPDAMENLISTMEKCRGKYMFFINLAEDKFSDVRNILKEHGFEEHIDFFNVRELNSNDNGYRFIQEM